MKIVVVAPRFPFPLDKGDRLTVFHLLKFLSRRHQVSLVSFPREPNVRTAVRLSPASRRRRVSADARSREYPRRSAEQCRPDRRSRP